MDIFKQPIRFEWDAGNVDKNFYKHQVVNEEAEQVFFDPHKRHYGAVSGFSKEERHLLVGRTKKGRALFVVFTLRSGKIRVVSARDLNRKEKKLL